MRKTSYLPALCWLTFITVLLCLPGSTLPKNQWLAAVHADKWVHIALFAVGAYLFCRPVISSGHNIRQRKYKLFIVVLAGVVYGTIMEFVQQYWVANRSFEWQDIAADSVGCLLAWWVSYRALPLNRTFQT